MRDFILIQITITNENRFVGLANMTVEEFRAARKIQNSYVISVRCHTIASLHGPAVFVMS